MEQTANYTPTPEYVPLLRGLDALATHLRAVSADAACRSAPLFPDDAVCDEAPLGSLATPPRWLTRHAPAPLLI